MFFFGGGVTLLKIIICIKKCNFIPPQTKASRKPLHYVMFVAVNSIRFHKMVLAVKHLLIEFRTC